MIKTLVLWSIALGAIFGLLSLLFLSPSPVATDPTPDRAVTEARARQEAAARERSAKETARARTEAETLLRDAQAIGIIYRYDCARAEAYVAPRAWTGANIDQKRALVRLVSTACDSYVTFLDSMSGRVVAKGSALGGVTIE